MRSRSWSSANYAKPCKHSVQVRRDARALRDNRGMRSAALLPVVVALGLVGFLAAASRASFPGVNGQIAVADRGIRSFDPDGGNPHRVWTATTQGPCGPCAFGTEGHPAWSPD